MVARQVEDPHVKDPRHQQVVDLGGALLNFDAEVMQDHGPC